MSITRVASRTAASIAAVFVLVAHGGCTAPATGPGDTLNYVPTGGFDSWTYNVMAGDSGLVERDLAQSAINQPTVVVPDSRKKTG